MNWIAKLWKALIDFFRPEYEETEGDTATRMLYRRNDEEN